MNTVYVTFKVEVTTHSSVWNRDERGEAVLEFDIPVEMVNSVNMSEILQSLLPIAYNDYVEKNKEEKDEE